MPKYFGTDGIRGVPFDFPLTEEMIERIGFSIAEILKDSKKTAFIARDTRKTGQRIARIISKGISKHGIKVFDLGVISTPSLSYLISMKKPSFGIMISASHNPPKYNGIKVFDSNGEKISEGVEKRIEDVISSYKVEDDSSKCNIERVNISGDYINYVVKIFKGIENNKKIVVDCSNGSTFKIAPMIFKKLNFEFEVVGAKPNGKNINLGCGALVPRFIEKRVINGKYWCGISYDGDGDRCIIVDENGGVIDGDDLIMLFSTYYLDSKVLKNNVVVLTQMSNYGLVRYLKDKGIKVIFVDVGDRNVLEAMKKYGAVIGGETSGHLILSRYLNTGDGVITSLEFLRVCHRMGINKVSDISKMWKRYPSILKSFEVSKRVPIEKIRNFKNFLKNEGKKIDGRIFVRYSGTEPVLRILAEGNANKDELTKVVDRVYDFYNQELLKIY